MIADQVISVTDLRTKTAKILSSLDGVKYIFSNNKPKAVLLNISEYEEFLKIKKIQAIHEEVKQAEEHGKRYINGDDLVDDLIKN